MDEKYVILLENWRNCCKGNAMTIQKCCIEGCNRMNIVQERIEIIGMKAKSCLIYYRTLWHTHTLEEYRNCGYRIFIWGSTVYWIVDIVKMPWLAKRFQNAIFWRYWKFLPWGDSYRSRTSPVFFFLKYLNKYGC